MAAWTLLVLTVLAGSVCSAPQSGRIVGGTETTIEEYPSLVQVEFRALIFWSQSCAASVLTSSWVLSAAHCFTGPLYRPDNRRIRAGSTFRNTGGVVSNVVLAYNHPTFGLLGNDGDITMVRLETPLVYGPDIQQGTIINQGGSIPDNMPVVHAGWGHTEQGGSHSDVLLETTIYTINNELCAARYQSLPDPVTVTENMICAGLLDVGGHDACDGDAGGPLYFSNIIIGIVSWGHGCANETYPGVSTAVASYTDWIVATAV